MRWSATPPTEPGTYETRPIPLEGQTYRPERRFVEVRTFQVGLIMCHMDGAWYKVERLDHLQWAGPVADPVEPDAPEVETPTVPAVAFVGLEVSHRFYVGGDDVDHPEMQHCWEERPYKALYPGGSYHATKDEAVAAVVRWAEAQVGANQGEGT